MGYKLTQTEYSEVEKLVEQCKYMPSLKHAQLYIDRVRFLGNGKLGRCGELLSRLTSSLSEYCKIHADKTRWGQFVFQDLYQLKECIEPAHSTENEETT